LLKKNDWPPNKQRKTTCQLKRLKIKDLVKRLLKLRRNV
jgi:hypothetical protein